jgi:hypothetical protein
MKRLPVQRVPARGRLEGARCNRSGYANYPLHPHLNQVGSDVEPTELIEGDLDSPQRKRFIRAAEEAHAAETNRQRLRGLVSRAGTSRHD